MEAEANAQRIHLPRIMDRDMFAVVGSLVTHETILLISFELNEAKRWVENVTDDISSQDPPPGEGCIFDCEAPIQYGLPCKCWLFPCVQLNLPIPISLIHPREFFDGPSKVVSWNMSFDLDLDFAQMMYQSQNPDPRKESSEPEEIKSLTGSAPLYAVPAAGFVSRDPWTKETHEGDRYRRKGSDLIEASTLDAVAFQKSLPNSQRAEEFAKEYAELTKEFIAKWKAKEVLDSQPKAEVI